MELNNLNRDKGVAGLTILLSVVVMLFVIGLLVTIFALIGGELQSSTATSTTTVSFFPNQTYNNKSNTSFANTTVLALDELSCSIFNVTNASTADLIGVANYTQGTGGAGSCYLAASDANDADANDNNTGWNVTFSFNYKKETTASGTIENSTIAVGSVTDWFDIFIVITAMVVLILLTVIIITAIRGSGLLGSGGTSAPGAGRAGGGGKPRNIGSA